MEDHFADSLDKTCRRAPPSLVSSILQITACCTVQARDLSSAQSLTYLSIRPPTADKARRHPSKTVLYQIKSSQLNPDFIAVSHTWDHPAHEKRANGGYYLLDTAVDGGKSSEVPDAVLDRVISYLEHSRCSLFWIDQECIDQRIEKTKQEAMQTMDVVYRRSQDSVGLLTVSIRRRRDIRLLLRLLRGKMTRKVGRHEAPQLMTDVGFYKACKLLGVLFRIASDRWWSRRWIFQEEYCAGEKMHLMIPHTPELEDIKRDGADIFGIIDGELRVNASRLREQTTRFCIAAVRAHLFTSKYNKRRCVKVLQNLKKYSVLERLGRYIGDDSAGRPMSARLLADVCRRDVKHPLDTLAIVANCCGYATRLDASLLKCNNADDLEIALLALVVLNGEILRNDIPCKPMSLLKFLRRHSLDGIEPPRGQKRLTFMKRCRLVNVRPRQAGVLTTGHLWRVCDVLSTKEHSQIASNQRSDWQRYCLLHLADTLSVQYGQLARDIRNFIRCRFPDGERTLGLTSILVDTVTQIAMAVQRGRNLFVARTDCEGEAWGIFCRCQGPRQPRTPPRMIFTADERADPHLGPMRSRFLDKHVSMEVTDMGEDEHGISRLGIGRWITGMCFSDTVSPQDVLLPWPVDLDKILPDSSPQHIRCMKHR